MTGTMTVPAEKRERLATATYIVSQLANLVLESERLFLLLLLDSPDGTAAMTSAPPPYDRKPFPLDGKWRGSIPKSLVRRGIIEAAKTTNGVEAEPSTRPTRKGSYVRRWQLIDRVAAQKRVAELSALTRQMAPGLFGELAVAWYSAQSDG